MCFCCIYVCIYIHMFVCTYIYVYMLLYIFVYIYMHMHIYTYIHINVYICIYVYICIHTCIYVYIGLTGGREGARERERERLPRQKCRSWPAILWSARPYVSLYAYSSGSRSMHRYDICYICNTSAEMPELASHSLVCATRCLPICI